jgi:hypothetical protein
MDKLQEIKKYLNNMNPDDENVIATKALLDSTKINQLGYKANEDFDSRIEDTIHILKKVKN